MARLKKNSVVKTVLGESVTVLEKLGEGGQGIVYKVQWHGDNYALKWYAKGVGKNADAFYKNLKNNVEKGAPAPTFLWPLAITEIDSDGCFGYVMKLRPKEYKDFSQIIMNRAKFSGFKAVVNAALLMTVSFKLLHNKGLSYQDLNDGNFFINPADGDVLICDNDNVAPDGENLGILGKPGYMAPEVVAMKHMPDASSDRFSLAVILFMLFFRNHPLAGMRDNDGDDPDANVKSLYCTNSIFIFDPKDTSNRPKPGIHINAPKFWPVFPPFIQELFVKAFDKSLMTPDGANREDRIIEKEWLKQLVRLRESIVTCPYCNSDTFYGLKSPQRTCMNCGQIVKRPPVLNIKDRLIPLQPGSCLYRYEVDSLTDYSVEIIKEPIGTVVQNKIHANVTGLRNDSDFTWYRHTPGGIEQFFEKGKVLPIAPDNTIKFGTFCEGKIEMLETK